MKRKTIRCFMDLHPSFKCLIHYYVFYIIMTLNITSWNSISIQLSSIFLEKKNRNLTDSHLHLYAIQQKTLLLQCAIMECLVKTVPNDVDNV